MIAITPNSFVELLFSDFDIILDNFQKEIEENNKQVIKKIANIHYKNNYSFPDYMDITVNRYYILKYGYAYGFYYSFIYRIILSLLDDNDKVIIKSLGCGCCLDYWSAIYANMLSYAGMREILYYGMDMVDWPIKTEMVSFKGYIFNLGKISDYFYESTKKGFGCNIFIFPKSLNEFTDEEVEKIEYGVKNKTFYHKVIIFCFVYNNNEPTQKESLFSSIIINSMKNRGDFIINDSKIEECGLLSLLKCSTNKWGKYYSFINDNQISYSIDTNFKKPQNILKYMGKLRMQCDSYIKNKGCGRCGISSCQISRANTITSTRYVSFQLAVFQKI